MEVSSFGFTIDVVLGHLPVSRILEHLTAIFGIVLLQN